MALIQDTMQTPTSAATDGLVLQFASEAIWSVDRAGITTFVNPAAAQAIGREVADLLGSSQHEVLRHSNRAAIPYEAANCPLCKAVQQGQPHVATDEEFWHADGTCFPVEYRSVPILQNGESVGSVLTFKNVSENRMAQSKVVHAQKLESIGQLAAGIAHEINTPTQYVGDNTRFLKDAFENFKQLVDICDRLLSAAKQDAIDKTLIEEATSILEAADIPYLSEEIPRAIDQSLEGINRVAQIVRAMKEFSHPDGDCMVPTDINRAIESTVTVARNEWKYVANMELELDPNLPMVSCLIGDLNQVVLNLVVNASHAIGDVVKDTNEKGTIRVSTRQDGDRAIIRISDTGSGIPPAARPRIFDPFFTTKAVGKGTGQGLSIAYQVVVEKHKGNISFETEMGKGTTFIINLPINGNPTAQEGES